VADQCTSILCRLIKSANPDDGIESVAPLPNLVDRRRKWRIAETNMKNEGGETVKTSIMIVSLFVCAFFLVQSDFSQSTSSKNSITMAALAGRWGFGHSLMLTYLDHGTGNYSHSGNIFGMAYTIKPDGTFVYKFAARYGVKTIREWGNGTVVISRDLITFKFDQGPAEKYKFVALETKADGGSIITLIQVVETSQHLKCGHNNGYFDCSGRQEWTRRRPGT